MHGNAKRLQLCKELVDKNGPRIHWEKKMCMADTYNNPNCGMEKNKVYYAFFMCNVKLF